MITVRDINVFQRTILLRVDFNIPINMEPTRILQSLPTIQHIQKNNGTTVLLTHYGRPDVSNPHHHTQFSLNKILATVKSIIPNLVFIGKDIEKIRTAQRGSILMVENTRLFEGEIQNCSKFAQYLAQFADIYINDAFSASHREHATTSAIASLLPSYYGLGLARELNSIGPILHTKKNICSIFGGSKVSTKAKSIASINSSRILLGGILANSLLKHQGIETGKSVTEHISSDNLILLQSKQIHMIQDIVTFDTDGNIAIKPVNLIEKHDSIMDIGPRTIDTFFSEMDKVDLILWNGPVGLYEDDNFKHGSLRILRHIENSGIYSIIGGGDTAAVADKIPKNAYVSTGGGALLDWISSNGVLPAITLLKS